MYRTSAAREDDRAKRSKDIVYIRDVMAAGREVVQQVELDIMELARSGAVAVAALRKAANQLSLLQGSSLILDEAARELAERDVVSFETARQDLLGHVIDLREILEASGATD